MAVILTLLGYNYLERNPPPLKKLSSMKTSVITPFTPGATSSGSQYELSERALLATD